MTFEALFSDPLSTLSVLLVLTTVWVVALVTVVLARRNRRDERVTIAEYQPPKQISPVYARYIVTTGRRSAVLGEPGVLDNQVLTLVRLYEAGLLSRLEIADDLSVVVYECAPGHAGVVCSQEERRFLELLIETVGVQGRLSVIRRRNERSRFGRGYEEIREMWHRFWDVEMYQRAQQDGYFKKSTAMSYILPTITLPATFGIFFAFFLQFIPVVGNWLAGIVILPFVLLYFLFHAGLALLGGVLPMDTSEILGDSEAVVTFFMIVMAISWFLWLFIFTRYSREAFVPFTARAFELIRKIEGHRLYLETVDQHRVSLADRVPEGSQEVVTTMSWLLVYGIARETHWKQWRDHVSRLLAEAPDG